MEELVLTIAALLGISPVTLVMMVPILVGLSNVTTRLIPDDATGILKVIRILTKVIGIYAANRVTTGVTVNDVAKTFAQGVILTPNKVRDATGKFIKRTDGSVSHKVGLTLGLLGLVIFLAGCETSKTWLANPCKYADKAQRVIDVAQQVVNQCPSAWANPQ